LEFLALVMLWLVDERPGEFEEYGHWTTLRQAARAIEHRRLLAPEIIETLLAVANLRNSVAHRALVYGVARAGGERGMYKGRHVFTDLAALKGLGEDVNTAALAILLRNKELERALDGR
jgi:hypothetical protein